MHMCVIHCFHIICYLYIYLASICIYLVHVVYPTLQLKQPPLVVSEDLSPECWPGRAKPIKNGVVALHCTFGFFTYKDISEWDAMQSVDVSNPYIYILYNGMSVCVHEVHMRWRIEMCMFKFKSSWNHAFHVLSLRDTMVSKSYTYT